MQCGVVGGGARWVRRAIAGVDEFTISVTRRPHGHSSDDLVEAPVCHSYIPCIPDVKVLEYFALKGIARVAGIK